VKNLSTLVFVMLTFLSSLLWAQYPGSPEKALTATLISKLYELNDAGQVFQAWKLLADQKDGYAVSAADIFGDKITVGKCVVQSNWKIVVGEEVRARLYQTYARSFQRSYIDFLNAHDRYPNSLEIELLYQNADDALGLPQYVSVDLLLNVIPDDWQKRVFFDRLSSFLGVGRLADNKHWYDYTKLSKARVVPESILAKNITVAEAEAIFEQDTRLVTKCMVRILKTSSKKDHETN
jgi:hypothetical protein